MGRMFHICSKFFRLLRSFVFFKLSFTCCLRKKTQRRVLVIPHNQELLCVFQWLNASNTFLMYLMKCWEHSGGSGSRLHPLSSSFHQESCEDQLPWFPLLRKLKSKAAAWYFWCFLKFETAALELLLLYAINPEATAHAVWWQPS